MAALAVALVPMAASAEGGVGIESSTEALHFTRLMPGDRESGRFTVTNSSRDEVVVSLTAEITGAAENGCLEPEANEGGDVTCGPEEGELDRWLTISVLEDGTPLWSGSVEGLDELVTLPASVAPGDVWDLEIAVELPVEATNEIMGDQLWFDLYVSAVAGEQQSVTQVLGVEATGQSGSQAPFPIVAVDAGLNVMGFDSITKAEPTRLILFGVLGSVVLAAAWLVVAERRRKRRW